MRVVVLLSTVVLLLPGQILAHDDHPDLVPSGDMTCLSSGGTPDHPIGRFLNRANPNAFNPQPLRFFFPTEPMVSGKVTTGLSTVGVVNDRFMVRGR